MMSWLLLSNSNRRSVDDCSLKTVRKLNDFRFEFCLSFAFRDERLDGFVDDIGDPHMFSLRFLAKPSHRLLVKTIERPTAFKTMESV
jgi:hypothetical protein